MAIAKGGNTMEKAKRIISILVTIVFLSSPFLAESPLPSKKLIQALEEEVSGEIAFRYMTRISLFDRIQSSEGFKVSKEQGWLLRKFLDEGKKVILKARLETEFYESQTEVLSVSMPS